MGLASLVVICSPCSARGGPGWSRWSWVARVEKDAGLSWIKVSMRADKLVARVSLVASKN